MIGTYGYFSVVFIISRYPSEEIGTRLERISQVRRMTEFSDEEELSSTISDKKKPVRKRKSKTDDSVNQSANVSVDPKLYLIRENPGGLLKYREGIYYRKGIDCRKG